VTEHAFDIPSIADIYKVSYLTMHGWEYDEYVKEWTKEGFKRCATSEDVDRFDMHCVRADLSKFTDLEEAYCAQLHSENRL
jgi:hypothetical protein